MTAGVTVTVVVSAVHPVISKTRPAVITIASKKPNILFLPVNFIDFLTSFFVNKNILSYYMLYMQYNKYIIWKSKIIPQGLFLLTLR